MNNVQRINSEIKRKNKENYDIDIMILCMKCVHNNHVLKSGVENQDYKIWVI
jgi:hypothetical protein